jgi:hypothetical protein
MDNVQNCDISDYEIFLCRFFRNIDHTYQMTMFHIPENINVNSFSISERYRRHSIFVLDENAYC